MERTESAGNVKEGNRTNGRVLHILHSLQQRCGHLSEEALKAAAKETGLPLSQLYAAATFYGFFRREKVKDFRRAGEEKAAGGRIAAGVRPGGAKGAQAVLEELERAGMAALYPDVPRIAVGMASCGRAAGAGRVFAAIKDELARRGAEALLVPVGCLGFCSREPLVSLLLPGRPRYIYAGLDERTGREFAAALACGVPYRENVLGVETEDRLITTRRTIPLGNRPAGLPLLEENAFFQKQVKIVNRNCGYIDPGNLAEYVARGGYRALARALAMEPAEIIAEIDRSGLRGRGGAGYPAGAKWAQVRETAADLRYVVCNANEGDPGVYVNRSLLESDPQSVLEGMIIGAYAVGASQGIIYLRADAGLALEILEHALAQARAYGFLGENILGSGFTFDLEIIPAPEAYVGGEETALIAALERGPAEPRPKPPFPAQQGLWGKPTCINNVETWANVPVIISRGAAWYARLGTRTSKGTKVFSLIGEVSNKGLVEVPMGTPVGEIVSGIGGGAPDARKLKAVQVGGPGGGFLPLELGMGLALGYEEFAGAGLMVSGGILVLDEGTCLVETARLLLTFFQEESCGKCVPCREGTELALSILTRIARGEAAAAELDELAEVCLAVKESSLCGLGQMAGHPVLSLLEHFRREFEEHVRNQKCPAGTCRLRRGHQEGRGNGEDRC